MDISPEFIEIPNNDKINPEYYGDILQTKQEYEVANFAVSLFEKGEMSEKVVGHDQIHWAELFQFVFAAYPELENPQTDYQRKLRRITFAAIFAHDEAYGYKKPSGKLGAGHENKSIDLLREHWQEFGLESEQEVECAAYLIEQTKFITGDANKERVAEVKANYEKGILSEYHTQDKTVTIDEQLAKDVTFTGSLMSIADVCAASHQYPGVTSRFFREFKDDDNLTYVVLGNYNGVNYGDGIDSYLGHTRNFFGFAFNERIKPLLGDGASENLSDGSKELGSRITIEYANGELEERLQTTFKTKKVQQRWQGRANNFLMFDDYFKALTSGDLKTARLCIISNNSYNLGSRLNAEEKIEILKGLSNGYPII